MNLNKKVTVLMPVYNAEKYVGAAIESILNQTYRDFDLLAIDDGSSDNSETIIRSFRDDRIKLVKNEKNMGIVKTLNKGLKLIDSTYIARMDSDDMAFPERLEKQVAFMDEHKDIAVSGTSILKFSDDGWKKKLKVDTEPKQIRSHLLYDNAFMHPTVMIRNEVMKKEQYEYDQNHIAMEDYGLWQTISLKYDVSNLEDILLHYRENHEGISQQAKKNVEERDQAFVTAYSHYFDKLNIHLSREELNQYRDFVSGKGRLKDQDWNKKLIEILNTILNELNPTLFDKEYFKKRLGQFYRINAVNLELSFSEAAKIHRTEFQSVFPYPSIEKAKFVAKKFNK